MTLFYFGGGGDGGGGGGGVRVGRSRTGDEKAGQGERVPPFLSPHPALRRAMRKALIFAQDFCRGLVIFAEACRGDFTEACRGDFYRGLPRRFLPRLAEAIFAEAIFAEAIFCRGLARRI